MEIKNKEKEIINNAINDNISYQNKSEESTWFIFKTKLSNTKDMIKYNLINFNTIYKFNSFANLQIFHKKFQKNETFQNYRNKLNSFIYLSYRKNFNKIKSYRTKNFFTSDCGWGCMIRSSQMILARAIFKILKTQGIKDKIERKIKTIQYFLDNPIPKDNIPQQLIPYKNKLLEKNTNKNEAIIKGIYSPFSIRMISNLGEIFKKSAGEWFSDVNLPLIYNIINSELKVIPDLKIYPFLSNIILKDIINDSFELINDDNNNNNEENILL
jgi:cysteine protease ATG4